MINLKATRDGDRISLWTTDVENVEANRQMLQDLGYEIEIEILDEVEG